MVKIQQQRLATIQGGQEKENLKTKLNRIFKRQARKAIHKKVIGITKKRVMWQDERS